jgi:hypothetical protein
MSESNNVKFVEVNGKWVWKCYDEQGSVTYRSPEFDSEVLAREDYEIKKDQSSASAALQAKDTAENTSSTEQSNTTGNAAPEGEVSAGTASPAESEAGLVS